MQRIIKTKSGIYILEIIAKKNFKLDIEKFQDIEFRKGYYYYVGSAQKNFYHRIKRHLSNNRENHWHIDYLLNSPTNKIKTIFALRNKPKEYECKLVNEMVKKFGLRFPAKGFGNSDCSICTSHLLFSTKKLTHNQFIALCQPIVRLIPSSKEAS